MISATRICATHTHLQMEVPKLLLRISTIEGQVPGLTDLPFQKLPYAVLSLIRSRPFPCNHSPPRCRPWTTLHPHPVHRVHLAPPALILYFSFSPRTPRLLHLLTTLLAPPLPFSFSQSSPLSLLRPPLQIPTPLASDIFIQLWRTTPQQPAHANQPTKLNRKKKKKSFKKQNQTRIFVQRDHQIFFTI